MSVIIELHLERMRDESHRRIDDREPNSGIPEIQRKRIRELNET